MAVYEVGNYRNFTLIGHGGSGKTQLAEALLFKAGVTTRLGNPTDKTSILDYTDEEKNRKSSCHTAPAYLTHKGMHVNFFDTPGTAAFCGEAIASLAAAELAVIVVSASAGVQVNTRKMFQRARDYGLGVWFVINHIDAANVDLPGVVAQIQESFGSQCVPLNLPVRGGKGVIDCFDNEKGEADFSSVEEAHTAVVEAIVSVDDGMLEKYLAGGLSKEEAKSASERAVAAGAFMPILFTNSLGDVGISEFLDALDAMCPCPVTGKQRVLKIGDREVPIKPDQSAPFVAQVIKLSFDPKSHIKYLVLRVHAGKLTPDMTLKTLSHPKGMRPGHISRSLGADHKEISAGVAGDLISLAKLEAKIGEVLCVDEPGEIEMPKFPKPMFSLAVEASAKGEADKLTAALRAIEEEDPCFYSDRGTGGELVVHGMGESQLRVYLERIKHDYKVGVETRPPRIPYRETITGRAENIEYTHKKQSGGAGQFGRVIINVLPAARGEGYEFVDKIFGGSIDLSYRPSVDKGIRGQCAEGVIAGFPVVDVKVELIDGKTHPVDSKDIAFQIAGRGAFKEGFMKAKPVLLEPIVNLEVTVPANYVGDITGDLASRRGRPQGQDVLPGNMAVVQATVPLAELADYSSRLSSITGGQGSFDMELSHYEVVPSNIQQQIIDQHKKEVEAAHAH
jgi:elongation factor G